jgi:hypothetical protein
MSKVSRFLKKTFGIPEVRLYVSQRDLDEAQTAFLTKASANGVNSATAGILWAYLLKLMEIKAK